jgi:hypothetical protein
MNRKIFINGVWCDARRWRHDANARLCYCAAAGSWERHAYTGFRRRGRLVGTTRVYRFQNCKGSSMTRRLFRGAGWLRSPAGALRAVSYPLRCDAKDHAVSFRLARGPQ